MPHSPIIGTRRRSLPSAARGDARIKIPAPAPTPPPPLRFHLGRRARAEEAEKHRFFIKLSPPASTHTQVQVDTYIQRKKYTHTHTVHHGDFSSQGSGEPIQEAKRHTSPFPKDISSQHRVRKTLGVTGMGKSSCFFFFSFFSYFRRISMFVSAKWDLGQRRQRFPSFHVSSADRARADRKPTREQSITFLFNSLSGPHMCQLIC